MASSGARWRGLKTTGSWRCWGVDDGGSKSTVRKQFMKEHKEALELEKRCHSESQLLSKPSVRLQYFANSIDQLKLVEEFPTSDFVSFGLDVWSNGSSGDERFRNASSSNSDPESDDALNLPDNPFFPSMAINI